MARLRCLLVAALLLALAGCQANPSSVSPEEQAVQELLALQAKSKSGVIELDTAVFEKYVVGKSRPYSLFVVADAKHLRNQGKLQLGALIRDYSAVARAFQAEHAGKPTAGKAFFASVEYNAAKDVMGRLGIGSLPFLGRVAPGSTVSKDAIYAWKDEEKMHPAAYPWAADAIGAFVAGRTRLSAGDVAAHASPRSRFLPVLTLAFVAALGALGYKLYSAPFLRHQWIYMVGAVFVYWFSTSGTMFNIIRGVPMVGYDPNSRQSIIFMQGSGQMGAEGFLMGTLYTTVGLAAAGLLWLTPRLSDKANQRVLAYGLLAVGVFAYRTIISTHTWKMGMRTHWYLPFLPF